MALTVYERIEKDKREKAEEERAIMARAAEIAAGSPLKFDESEMNSALEAFVAFKKCSYRYWGHVQDFLQVNGVSTLFGSPHCQSCNQYFSDGKAWAKHVMSYSHFLVSKGATHKAVMELRAHLHAFPAPKEEFDQLDYYKLSATYRFRNLATDGENESP